MFTLRIPKFITSIVDTELKEEGSYQSGRNAYYGITIGKKIPLKNTKFNLELFIGGGSSQSITNTTIKKGIEFLRILILRKTLTKVVKN
jgi:hypothetical protein